MKLCTILLLLTGCAVGPTKQEIAKADYGRPIAEQSAQAIASAWAKGVLKDPGSARFAWGKFYKGGRTPSVFEKGGTIFGYILEGRVNARNSFGGYTGYRRWVFIFHNGYVVAVFQYQKQYGMVRIQ